jgi:hypothetical protein
MSHVGSLIPGVLSRQQGDDFAGLDDLVHVVGI